MRAPLVTVVTPVYNDAQYLRECIESVQGQTYPHWEHVIVDNRSTDDSLAIAQECAAADRRIRVIVNDEHVSVIPNHNIAVRSVSAASAYCKVVEADDWIFPHCLAAMVAVAESRPSVGLVSAYRLHGDWVDLDGFPSGGERPGTTVDRDGLAWPTSVVGGGDICRLSLLGAPYLFGSPTSVLVRADLVRRRDPFFDESSLHADKAACFDVLQEADFGFVHQVLTFTRPHDDAGVTALSNRFNTYLAGNLGILATYGPRCLGAPEYARCLSEHLDRYYTFLARNVVARRSREFWAFHEAALEAVGQPLSRARVIRALLRDVARLPFRLERGLDALDRLRRHARSGQRPDEIREVLERMQARRMSGDAAPRPATTRIRAVSPSGDPQASVHSCGLTRSTASADVITGTTSKSMRSFH